MHLFIKHFGFGASTPTRDFLIKNKKRAFTVAYEIPAYGAFENALKSLISTGAHPPIALRAGQAICHPKDNFIRRVGARKAVEVMIPYSCQIVGVIPTGDGKLMVRLMDKSRGQVFIIDLDTVKQQARIMVEG